MGEGKLPNFKRFYERSDVFTTYPDVEGAHELEPWIQWYSVHTGLAYDQHKVFHLTDGPAAGHEDIWRALGNLGISTGNFSSMNAAVTPLAGSFGLPDPWCTSERAHPPSLQVFQDFIQSQVQEYTNRSRKDNVVELAKFAAFLMTSGLAPATASSIISQLTNEKIGSGDASWKRAVYLDRLLFDVFRHYFKKQRPGFSTFFANSTAHYQHAYWRHMQPEAFLNKPDAREEELYKDAILFGYQSMDHLLGQFFRLEEEAGAMLILMTALSQQPFLKYEDIGGQRFYRPHNVEQMLRDAGIDFIDVQPVMTHQFAARFATNEEATRARETLDRHKVDAGRVFETRLEGDCSVYFGCTLREKISMDASMIAGNETLRFGDVFYQIDGAKSGCHHPDGVLWIKTGAHHKHADKASILDLFPTLIDWYGGAATGYAGRSLLPDLVGKVAA